MTVSTHAAWTATLRQGPSLPRLRMDGGGALACPCHRGINATQGEDLCAQRDLDVSSWSAC